jgi:hypothetical protein
VSVPDLPVKLFVAYALAGARFGNIEIECEHPYDQIDEVRDAEKVITDRLEAEGIFPGKVIVLNWIVLSDRRQSPPSTRPNDGSPESTDTAAENKR